MMMLLVMILMMMICQQDLLDKLSGDADEVCLEDLFDDSVNGESDNNDDDDVIVI